jgi:DUF1707 SHOCT-like domain/Cell wall-active antibiotics response LiaF, C-terminal
VLELSIPGVTLAVPMADLDLRASDDDRERTADHLRQAAAQGRITVDELEERLQVAYAARTQGELVRLVADLPAPTERPAGRLPVRRGEGGTSWLVSIMGGHDRHGHWRIAPRLTVINVMGGSDLDLHEAELADDEVVITVFSLMGGADIRVPEGLNVEISQFAFMGGNGVELGPSHPDPGGPVVRIRMLSIMGGSDVKRGRRLTRAERRQQRLERRAGR